MFENGLCLPSGSNLADDERERIVKKMKEVFVVLVHRADGEVIAESEYYEGYPRWEAIADEFYEHEGSNYATVEKRFIKEEDLV